MNIALFNRPQPKNQLLPGTYPLTDVPSNHTVQLLHIDAGRKAAQRLAEMGLTPGVQFDVLQNNGGPLLLRVRGSRLAVGRGMAEKIQVRIQGEG